MIRTNNQNKEIKITTINNLQFAKKIDFTQENKSNEDSKDWCNASDFRVYGGGRKGKENHCHFTLLKTLLQEVINCSTLLEIQSYA